MNPEQPEQPHNPSAQPPNQPAQGTPIRVGYSKEQGLILLGIQDQTLAMEPLQALALIQMLVHHVGVAFIQGANPQVDEKPRPRILRPMGIN